MTTHQLNGKELLVVDTPSVAFGLKLPKGSWKIIRTEEDARGVVESHWPEYSEEIDMLYKDYSDNIYRFQKSLESLHSWIRSKGKDPKLVVCLLKND